MEIQNKSNGMATAGFVLSLMATILGWIIWLLGLIFSSVGLAKANKIGGEGKGIAIAGLVISLVGFILILLLASSIAVFLFGVA